MFDIVGAGSGPSPVADPPTAPDTIPAGVTETIPTGRVFIIGQTLTIAGTLVMDGTLLFV